MAQVRKGTLTVTKRMTAGKPVTKVSDTQDQQYRKAGTKNALAGLNPKTMSGGNYGVNKTQNKAYSVKTNNSSRKSTFTPPDGSVKSTPSVGQGSQTPRYMRASKPLLKMTGNSRQDGNVRSNPVGPQIFGKSSPTNVRMRANKPTGDVKAIMNGVLKSAIKTPNKGKLASDAGYVGFKATPPSKNYTRIKKAKAVSFKPMTGPPGSGGKRISASSKKLRNSQ